MNAKQLLSEYTDACELIKETENDIRRLETKKSASICDKVKGSIKEFPYTERSFSISGKPDKTIVEKKIDSEYAHNTTEEGVRKEFERFLKKI